MKNKFILLLYTNAYLFEKGIEIITNDEVKKLKNVNKEKNM